MQIEENIALLNLHRMSIPEILAFHVSLSEELRARGVVRSANSPTGDLAEHVFCTAFGWEQAPNSKRGYDAVDRDGTRYQIKGRRIHRRNKSRQLSAIRDLGHEHFDVLAAVLFDDDYAVMRAALIPRSIVEARSKYNPHTNSNILVLQDDVWALDGVQDVTNRIRAAII